MFKKSFKSNCERISVNTPTGKEKKSKTEFKQCTHMKNDCIVATSIEATPNCVRVYDSVFNVVDDHTALLITNLFGSLAKPTAVVIPKQLRSNDCHVFVIANAATNDFGKDATTLHFNQAI